MRRLSNISSKAITDNEFFGFLFQKLYKKKRSILNCLVEREKGRERGSLREREGGGGEGGGI